MPRVSAVENCGGDVENTEISNSVRGGDQRSEAAKIRNAKRLGFDLGLDEWLRRRSGGIGGGGIKKGRTELARIAQRETVIDIYIYI